MAKLGRWVAKFEGDGWLNWRDGCLSLEDGCLSLRSWVAELREMGG